MYLFKLMLAFVFAGVGLYGLFFTLLIPFNMLWVGDAPSYSDEYIRNHILSSLGYGSASAVLTAAALYGSYSLFMDKNNIWSKISFGIVILSIISFFGFFGIATLIDSRY